MIYNTTPPASLIDIKSLVAFELSQMGKAAPGLAVKVQFANPQTANCKLTTANCKPTAVMTDHEAGLINEKTRSPRFGIAWLYRFYIEIIMSPNGLEDQLIKNIIQALVQRLRKLPFDCYYTNPCCPFEEQPHIGVIYEDITPSKYLLTVEVHRAV